MVCCEPGVKVTTAGVWIGALVAFLALLIAASRGVGEQLQALHRALHGFSGIGSGVVAVLVATNALLYLLVVRPLRRIGQVADQLSLNDMSAAEFPAGGSQEIQSLARSFGRMRKSLDKALRLLET